MDALDILVRALSVPAPMGPSGTLWQYHPQSDRHSKGYDGLAIVVIDMVNDGVTPVTLVTGPPAPPPGDIFNYDAMLTRVANEYDAAFAGI